MGYSLILGMYRMDLEQCYSAFEKKGDKIQINLPVLNPVLKTISGQDDQIYDLESVPRSVKEIGNNPSQEEDADYLEGGSFNDNAGQDKRRRVGAR